MSTFRALVVTKPDTGYSCNFADFDELDLMDGGRTERWRSWHAAEDGGEVGPALGARRYGVLAPGQGRSRWSRRGAARSASP